MKKLFLAAMLFPVCLGGIAQDKATLKEFRKDFTNYPFADPGPIPDPSSKIYPYFQYDGFSIQPQQKEWKVVEHQCKLHIGVLDLLTQTKWRLEVNLPADKACFTTRSVWFTCELTHMPT